MSLISKCIQICLDEEPGPTIPARHAEAILRQWGYDPNYLDLMNLRANVKAANAAGLKDGPERNEKLALRWQL